MSRFLLVSLNIKAILQETTLYLRREKLCAITSGLGLGDVYGATIQRIRAQGGDRARLGMEALMWISHSERPLNVDEICHALAVEIGSTDNNASNAPSIRTVLGCCQGLAAVDNGSSTVRLIHFTLKEYLLGHGDLFDKTHSTIAETCLTYLNFRAINDISASDPRNYLEAPFLKYSSLYWGTHMRKGLSDRSKCLALDFLDGYENHISAKLLCRSTVEGHLFGKPFSGLHYVSYFGIAEVAIDMIRTKRWDLNQRDSMGLTPLMWAARQGREDVVKLLLEQKHTQPDMVDTKCGRTALSWATGSGHEGVVRLFLGPLFVNPRSIGRWRGAPEVMGALFGKKYVNLNKPDNYGQTPLSRAAENGHDGAVKLLLEREDVSPNKPDDRGRTPLSLAAGNGHGGVVKLLLERDDVSPDRPDNGGQTPLSRAAENGHDGAVKLLLEREDITPDRPDTYGQTPLSQAAMNGRDGVVKLLLEREDINPDKSDRYYQTPLSWAAENGHDGVVKLLLERGDVNPDRPDNRGQTLLSWAAENGRDGVVELLLERGDVNPNRPDNDSRTPLSRAALNGRDGVVKLLLEREDINPDMPDNYGKTPLALAAQHGCDGVEKLLKARKLATPSAA